MSSRAFASARSRSRRNAARAAYKTLSKVDPSFRRLKRDDSHGVRLLGARGACGPVDADDADDGYHPPAHVAVANVENPLQIPWEN